MKYQDAIKKLEKIASENSETCYRKTPNRKLFKASYCLAGIYAKCGKNDKAKAHLDTAVSEFRKMCKDYLDSNKYVSVNEKDFSYRMQLIESPEERRLARTKKHLGNIANKINDYRLIGEIAFIDASHNVKEKFPFDDLSYRIAAA